MTNGILSDWEIRDLMQVCREMLKSQRNWLAIYGDCYMHESPPNPCNFRHYLQIKRIVTESMKYRREHRKAVNHIWKVYAESVAENFKKMGLEEVK